MSKLPLFYTDLVAAEERRARAEFLRFVVGFAAVAAAASIALVVRG